MKRIYIKRILYVVLISAIIPISSCKSKRDIIKLTSPVEDKANSELFSDILDNALEFESLSARLNIGLTTKSNSLSSKAQMKLLKDRGMMVSVQPLFGIEVLRLYIDPDYVVLIDRMNKRYVRESMETVKSLYPMGFDYYTLQSILTNSLFVSGKKDVTKDDYHLFNYNKSSEHSYYLTNRDNESQVDYSFSVNGDDKITFTNLTQQDTGYSLQWTYSSFVALGKGEIFPQRMNSTLMNSKRRLDVTMDFTNFVVDEPVELSVDIPDSYNKVSIADIIRLITKS